MTIPEVQPARLGDFPGMLWLDLTRKCQLSCSHCYNESGPRGHHGVMERKDWVRALDQAAESGIERVQFIGGEPTPHPDFSDLLEHSLVRGLRVEVFSNLVHISEGTWELFRRPGVSLATSYYSHRAELHDAMTGRRSHARSRANIERALALGIPLRAGIIGKDEKQMREAGKELASLGVGAIGFDRVREFGRGAGGVEPDASNLCGRCGDGRAAIGPDGTVSPCVFSAWMGVGNIRNKGLAGILAGASMARANATIREAVDGNRNRADMKCQPEQCYPTQQPCYPANPPCQPNGSLPPSCGPNDDECRPGHPSTDCTPRR
ncbi:radical SAM protein [Streptomyces alkaliphilus]|uniref:radical SAM protein n=1 Tax=Streptomyces alkaliphilus TaxID=1472722 RepID=UPI00117FA950|nr:radical SAM protein [Streptomyces alkaliphilus]MQS05781.1 radical SAM protein [Streptomyces alkaliphilus]